MDKDTPAAIAFVLACFVVAVLSIVTVVHLSGGNSSNEGEQCYHALTSTQRQTVEAYERTHPAAAMPDAKHQSICVLEPSNANGFVAVFYRSSSQFPYFGDYMTLSHVTDTVGTVGKVKGTITPVDTVTLESLRGVRTNGTVYEPYTQKGGTWNRSTTTVRSFKVSGVRFGASAKTFTPAKAFGSSSTRSGFTVSRVPESDGNEGSVSEGGSFHVTPVQEGGGFGEEGGVHEDPEPVHVSVGDDG